MHKESLQRVNHIRRLSVSHSQESRNQKWEIVREELRWINQMLSKNGFNLTRYLLQNPEMGSLLKTQMDTNKAIEDILDP